MAPPNGALVPGRYRFGQYEFDCETSRLLRNGMPVKLQSQPARVLTLLLEAGGQVVTREEIQRDLWPDASFGNFDTGLNTAIRKLRDALDDVPSNPRFVETLPRLGYRFLAPIEKLGLPEAKEPEAAGGRMSRMEPSAEDLPSLGHDQRAESDFRGAPARLNPEIRARRIRWVMAGLVGGILLITLVGLIGPRVWTTTPTEPLRLSLTLPPGHALPYVPRGPKLAISPNGAEVYYVGLVEGATHVYRRNLTKPEVEQIPGTEGTQSLAISPDGRRLAVYRGNQVWSLDLSTLSMTMVTPKDWLPAPVQSFAWGFDGRLYLASAAVERSDGKAPPSWAQGGVVESRLLARQRIYRATPDFASWEVFGKAVSSSPSRGDEYQFPNQVTADGRLVFSAIWGPFDRAVYARDLRSGADTLLSIRGLGGFLTNAGELLYYWRGDLVGRRVDRTWPQERASVALATGLPDAGWGAAHFAASQQGTLVYLERPPMESFELLWVDRDGKETPIPVAAGSYQPLDLSRDGERLLLGIVERNGMTAVWQLSLKTGEWKRMLATAPNPAGGVWSPDGKFAMVASFRGELRFPNVFAVARDGVGSAQRLVPSEFGQYPMSWPSETSPLVYTRSGVRATGTDIGMLSISAGEAGSRGSGGTLRVTEDRILALPGDQTNPSLSPDGRWLAFIQDVAGSRTLRVCRLPACDAPVALAARSREESPVWDSDSTSLYFRSGADIWETRVIANGAAIELATPRRLFEDRYAQPDYWVRQMIYHAPTRRFLFARSLKPAEPIRQIQVVLQWPKLLDSAPPAAPGVGTPSAP